IEHGSERGGLARSGGSGHQDDAVEQFGNFTDLWRQIEVDESGDGLRNDTHDNGVAAALLKNVDAKAAMARETIGDVAGSLILQGVESLLVAGDQFVGDAARVLGSQGRHA